VAGGAAANAYVLYSVEVVADAKLIGLVRLPDPEPEAGCAELVIYLGQNGRAPLAPCRRTAARCVTG
jgi:hypothetical protein